MPAHYQKRCELMRRNQKARKSFPKDMKSYLFFCGPTVLIFTLVMIVPFIFGLFLTFTNWDGIARSYTFVGFDNYVKTVGDTAFWNSLWLTIQYVLFTVLLTNIIAFLLAYALTSGLRSQNVFRAGFFTPNLIGGIILGLIWNFVFTTVLPFIGQALNLDFITSSMLSHPIRAFWAIVIVSVWQYSGYMMVIYIAGFMNVPKQIIEAANIDGAGPIQKLTKVIIPLMVPAFIICTFLTLQRAFMVYDVNLSLTGGGPFKSTQLISMHVYEKAFLAQEYGVGQTQAIFLFGIVAIVTVTQLYYSKKLEHEE